ncbi:MAG: PQQ-binding-like beta-propeller repeat protein [Syntrophaceae bacterium]|nr:PQQ-binding-like beta-propeller repeat protein [Syntrophaceae bacterium]
MNKWPEAGPEMLWHFDELGEGHSSAAVTSSGVYTTGMINGTGYVFAFDLKGKLLWKKEYGPEWTESHYGARSTPLVIKDKLYLISSFGRLFCMNTANGQIIWSIDTFKEFGGRNIKWGVTENLLHDGNILYASPGGPGASIIAVDRNTGKLLWKGNGPDEKSAYCSPLLIQLPSRKLLVTRMERSIQGYDASTGKFLWNFEFNKDPFVHPNVPVYIDGMLYCVSGYGLGGVMLKLAPDGSSVTEIWRNAMLDPKMHGVVVLDGRIYGAGDRNRRFFCLDWKTGKEIFALNQLAPANIISNEGLLYIYSENGTVSLAKPKPDGLDILSSFKVPLGAGTHWAHLVINNKKLYVRHGNSMMVYDIAGK